ncbi:MAG: caspase family protein [Magnetococcales bacterium]|nr:caspase family protein [Magnetococcales bacterium]
MNIRYFLILLMFLGFTFLTQEESIAQTSNCNVAREITQKGIELIVDQPKKGLEALFKARNNCRTDVAVGYNLALALYRAGRLEEAKDLWQNLHKSHPNDYKTMANLAWLQFELGYDERAHILAFDGLIKFPDSVAMAHTKLYALLRMGRYLEAYDWLSATKLKTPRIKEWKDMAASFVSESLWQQFLSGENMIALKKSINFLVVEYPEEQIFSRTKDQLVISEVDPDAERPYPVFLPHQVWPKYGNIDNRNDEIDTRINTFPSLHKWRKREDAFAVIIGITAYKRLSPRYFGARDARNMHTLVTRRGDFIDDMKQVKLRIDREATLHNVTHDLNWLITKGKTHPNAKLFIYFAGLGFSWKGGEDALLVPFDTLRPEISPKTTISIKKLKEDLAQLPNKEIAVVVDACFGDDGVCGLNDNISATQIGSSFFSGNATWAVSALSGVAKAHPSGRQGAFTYYLINGFLGDADGYQAGRVIGEKDGWVSVSEAFHYSRIQQEKHEIESDSFLSSVNKIRLTRIGGEK